MRGSSPKFGTIEHDYGHGYNNLCYNFYNFTLLAFTMRQIHQLTDKLFQKMLCQFGRLGSLWEEIRAMVHRLYFLSMEALWEFLAGDFDYEPPPR